MTKKILGLDLGVTSIGWALISENESKKEMDVNYLYSLETSTQLMTYVM